MTESGPDNEAPVIPVEDYRGGASLTRRSVTFGVGLMVATVLTTLILVSPAPYAIRGPGPTEDTLGETSSGSLITIDGAETYPTTGKLLLTTVSVAGGPGYPVTPVDVIQAWVSPTYSVRPVEETFPRHQTEEESQEIQTQQMVSSQENATVAALTELGYEVPAVLTVVAAVPGSGADGVLQQDDVITGINGMSLPTYQALIEYLAGVTPGDTVTVTVTRGGSAQEVQVVTGDGGDSAVLGVYLDPTFDYPVDVTIQIENIGGPSAGTMFALGIIDKLTPEDEVNGQVIAGTGAMDVGGAVGRIGGIEQKMHGAVAAGATWFLAPKENCGEVVGNIPDGLKVVSVSTLGEAREAMVAIGSGNADSLPGCS